MDNLFTLKPWLTVQETAKILSKELNHEINEADVFGYALNHKLTLSVNFAGSVSGIFGYYHTTWNGNLGMTRFKPSDRKFDGYLSGEALELELTYCHVGRGIVDHIYRKLSNLPAYPLPEKGDLAVNIQESKYSDSVDKFYICHGTVFMVRNVSYNEKTGCLETDVAENRTVKGGFVVGTDAILEFIRNAKKPDNTKAIPQLEIAQDEKESDEAESLVEERTPSLEITEDSGSFNEIAKFFDPLPIKGIKVLFETIPNTNTNTNWNKWFGRASRNELSKARTSKGMYNPVLVGDWLVNKGYATRCHVNGKLRNNLPQRSQDKRYLLEIEMK